MLSTLEWFSSMVTRRINPTLAITRFEVTASSVVALVIPGTCRSPSFRRTDAHGIVSWWHNKRR
jgi:hypothetical protein